MTDTAAHTIKIQGVCNGGGKARRAHCSCGAFGVRFAYSPGSIKKAQAKAEADGAKHVAKTSPGEHW